MKQEYHDDVGRQNGYSLCSGILLEFFRSLSFHFLSEYAKDTEQNCSDGLVFESVAAL